MNGRRIRHMEQEFKRESIFISSSKLYELHCISPIWFKLVLIEVKKKYYKIYESIPNYVFYDKHQNWKLN